MAPVEPIRAKEYLNGRLDTDAVRSIKCIINCSFQGFLPRFSVPE